MEPTVDQRLGAVVEFCLEASIDAWIAEHAPSTPRPEVYASALISTEVLVLRQSGGRLNVTVSCIARRRTEDAAYFFRYRGLPGGWYRYIAGSTKK